MRKNCETCKHDDKDYPCYPHKEPCNECERISDTPSKWEAAEHYKPQTNADRIRAMSDEELAELFGAILREREIILLQQLRKQGVEASIVEMPELTLIANLEWLKQPAEETVYCKDCEHLMFSDCYGECSKAYKGIVHPDDTCEHGVRRKANGV